MLISRTALVVVVVGLCGASVNGFSPMSLSPASVSRRETVLNSPPDLQSSGQSHIRLGDGVSS